jgi:hypothetical protein
VECQRIAADGVGPRQVDHILIDSVLGERGRDDQRAGGGALGRQHDLRGRAELDAIQDESAAGEREIDLGGVVGPGHGGRCGAGAVVVATGGERRQGEDEERSAEGAHRGESFVRVMALLPSPPLLAGTVEPTRGAGSCQSGPPAGAGTPSFPGPYVV